MDYLTEATDNQFVLAGRDSKIDTNVATASSVIGGILGVIEAYNEDISKLKFTVQGCGKVGRNVATELLRLGATFVQTCDLYTELSNVEGCIPVEDWANTECDFLVPCANSLAIDESVATNFPKGVKYCVGAANSPFANAKARSIFDNRGVVHIPESISSAGAILADSVEVSFLYHGVDVESTKYLVILTTLSFDLQQHKQPNSGSTWIYIKLWSLH